MPGGREVRRQGLQLRELLLHRIKFEPLKHFDRITNWQTGKVVNRVTKKTYTKRLGT